MSIYVLMEYIELCKGIGLEPTPKGLKYFKEKYWRE
ncbi:hypothetical protein IYC_20666 [Clostridium sporogenes PA 3679]|nr:hypothetical protein IYC_20666 [Clostridium sporogenes PA 3679]